VSVIRKWAVKWNIPYAAVADLEREMGVLPLEAFPPLAVEFATKDEAYQQDLVRLHVARLGWRLWRNNVGALKDDRGVPVRYGLANDSAQLNKVLKSSDLIGWRKVTVTADMVGTAIAQFVAIEMKEPAWTFGGDKHELAQQAWLNLVVADGGYAKFSTGPENL
jgi:hypothetical protein